MVRTVIGAIETIWAACPSARIIHADPGFQMGFLWPNPLSADCQQTRGQIWDMIAGRAAPELGGQPHYLGWLEVICPSCHHLTDHSATSPWLLRQTLDDLYQRYKRPMLVTVPAYAKVTRFAQLQALCHEVRAARQAGLPIDGLCLPPSFNRPNPLRFQPEHPLPAAISPFHQLPLAVEAPAVV